MLTTTRLHARLEGNQDEALCAVYMVAPTMQITKISAHPPPDTPLRGRGLPVIDQNRISISRMPPQAISRNGQNREIRSTNGTSGHRLRNKNRTPSPIRISGPITEPRLILRFLRVFFRLPVRRVVRRLGRLGRGPDSRPDKAAPAWHPIAPEVLARRRR